jgi:hypothetical protein
LWFALVAFACFTESRIRDSRRLLKVLPAENPGHLLAALVLLLVVAAITMLAWEIIKRQKMSSIVPEGTSTECSRPPRVFRYNNLKRVETSAKLPMLQEIPQFQSLAAHAIFRVFYFVHVPKTGGTALKLSLQDRQALMHSSVMTPRNMLLQGLHVKQPHSNKRTPSYTRVMSRGHLSATDIDPRIRTFCFLREPYSRVRSAFRYLLEGGEHNELWDFPERKMMQLFRTHKIRALSDIFELRNTQVKEEILNHPHMRPQHTFVCEKGTIKVLVDHVFLLEYVRTKDIATLLHIPDFTLAHKNKSHLKYALTEKDTQSIQEHYQTDIDLYEKYK